MIHVDQWLCFTGEFAFEITPFVIFNVTDHLQVIQKLSELCSLSLLYFPSYFLHI